MLGFHNPLTSNVYTTCICWISSSAVVIGHLVPGISENLAFFRQLIVMTIRKYKTFRLLGIQRKSEYIYYKENPILFLVIPMGYER